MGGTKGFRSSPNPLHFLPPVVTSSRRVSRYTRSPPSERPEGVEWIERREERQDTTRPKGVNDRRGMTEWSEVRHDKEKMDRDANKEFLLSGYCRSYLIHLILSPLTTPSRRRPGRPARVARVRTGWRRDGGHERRTSVARRSAKTREPENRRAVRSSCRSCFPRTLTSSVPSLLSSISFVTSGHGLRLAIRRPDVTRRR